MNAAQRQQHSSLLRKAGYEDSEALTLNSTDGNVPSGRELSLSWLAGTVMTGVTSVALMGAALYMAFLGEDTFSTPFAAFIVENEVSAAKLSSEKTDRLVLVTQAKSERELIEASIRVDESGVSRIRRQGFDRIRATLATSKSALADDIPAYDPVALLNRTQTNENLVSTDISTDIYGSEVQGEIVVRNVALNLAQRPSRHISDQVASEFVRVAVDGAYVPGDDSALGYAAQNNSIIELSDFDDGLSGGTLQNVSLVPKSTRADEATLGTSERIVKVETDSTLGQVLSDQGLSSAQINAILSALPLLNTNTRVAAGAHLRILFGPDRTQTNLVPLRLAVYAGERFVASAALSDQGVFVTGQEPDAIEFPEETTEEVNVNNLPSIYRAIWETGRKYEMKDEDIDRMVAMYAYDLDLTKRVAPGDAIEILQTEATDPTEKQLIYVALTLDGVKREFFRHTLPDSSVAFFDPNGETGKRFLTRRPLEGGGNLRSRFGYRIHPIFKTRKLHAGVDLAARTGTKIYASGDGVIQRAQWVSGYGRYISIKHVNGYSTAYAHMHKLADGMKPGVRVKQGQLIGYVGSTGYSTGPHLHFEVRVNGNPVDPLKVRLPRANTLPASEQIRFSQSMQQVRELMLREIEPEVTIAGLAK